MARHTATLDDRLFLSTLQAPEPAGLRQRVAEMERLFAAAQEEIALLTHERDEVVAALKKWAKADPLERLELRIEATTRTLRAELNALRAENRRLKREILDAHGPGPDRRLRA